MSILNNYLNKLGIKSSKNLTGAELEVYQEWSNALKGRKITDIDVVNFITGMKERCIEKLRDVTELNQKQLLFWSMQLDFISQIESFINSPEVEREQVTRQINSLQSTL